MRNPAIDRKGSLKPRGEQCFVNYQYVDAGMVAWTDGGKKAPQWGAPTAHIVGNPSGAYGVSLKAEQARLVGPIFELDRPWECNYNMYFTAVMYEDGLYRAWYSCIPSDHMEKTDPRYKMASGQILCYATSKDGIHWEKPNLGLLSYNGMDTNACFGRDLSPYGFQSGSIFVDPVGTPEQKYKMIYIGLKPVDDLEAAKKKYKEIFGDAVDRKGFTTVDDQAYVKAMYAATSPDGIHWNCVEEPIMIQPSDTLNTCVWDEDRQAYVAYIRLRHGDRRVVGRAESKDFFCWKQAPEIALKAPLDWSPCDDIYTNNRMNYPGSSQKLMFPNVYHRFTDSRNIYLASSEDDFVWELLPGGPVVKADGCGAWCVGDLNPGLGMVPYGEDEMAMPVLGYARPHKFSRGGDQKLGQPGFAVWKKGRLAAIAAEERGGFSTPKLLPAKDKLKLNFSTKPAGMIQVELRGAKGEVLPGYSFDECEPLVGNEIAHIVTWNGKSELGELAQQDIVVAFRMYSAKLYSFEFVD